MKFFSASLPLVTLFLLFGTAIWAQSKTITGRIVSDDGKPLQNVSITVKGRSAGTQSKADGGFAIIASPGETLVFSSVGYEPAEIRVGQSSLIQVSLKPG